MTIHGPARSPGIALLATAALSLAACTAAAPSPEPIGVSLPGAPTLRSIIDAEPEHPTFELVQETTDFDGDHAEVVSYRSGDLDLQAVIRRPLSGAAGSPAIVLVHGDADPEEYSGLTDYDDVADEMVARGYVVVMPDLRNYGDSEDDPAWGTDMDVGATLDTINAARAIAEDPMVDPERIALAGHSSGGRVVVNAAVATPDVAAAVVAVAPSHASAWENVEHFAAGTPFYDTIVAAHGDPEESPDYWRDVSALTFVERASAPLLVFHGTADDIVPIGWSRLLAAEWSAAGKNIDLVELEGADHWTSAVAPRVYELLSDFLSEHMP